MESRVKFNAPTGAACVSCPHGRQTQPLSQTIALDGAWEVFSYRPLRIYFPSFYTCNMSSTAFSTGDAFINSYTSSQTLRSASFYPYALFMQRFCCNTSGFAATRSCFAHITIFETSVKLVCGYCWPINEQSFIKFPKVRKRFQILFWWKFPLH